MELEFSVLGSLKESVKFIMNHWKEIIKKLKIPILMFIILQIIVCGIEENPVFLRRVPVYPIMMVTMLFNIIISNAISRMVVNGDCEKQLWGVPEKRTLWFNLKLMAVIYIGFLVIMVAFGILRQGHLELLPLVLIGVPLAICLWYGWGRIVLYFPAMALNHPIRMTDVYWATEGMGWKMVLISSLPTVILLSIGMVFGYSITDFGLLAAIVTAFFLLFQLIWNSTIAALIYKKNITHIHLSNQSEPAKNHAYG